MKIIGITKVGYSDAYVAIVEHSELERAFEKGYGKLDKLKADDIVRLDDLPNQRERITQACQDMTRAFESFQKAAPVMAAAANVLAAERREQQA